MIRSFLSLFLILISLNSYAAVTISPIKKLQQDYPDIKYTKVHNSARLHFNVFPIASSKSSTYADPVIPETFVVSIPHGKVFSNNGYIMVEDSLIKELIWPWSPIIKRPNEFEIKNLPAVKHIPGKVAVITQEGHRNYYHWMTEILPKIALLNIKQIQFDWILVPKLDLPFMKISLEALGIDSNKIIEADPNTYIEADELIVPSFVSKSCYTPRWVVEYMRDHFLPFAGVMQNKEKNDGNFFPAKNVFISRSKASYRRILNEDEIFNMLEPYGFKRYYLEELPLSQQIILFQNAKVIVAPHGAGLTNLLFANPETHVFEIFQQHEDDTFWYLSQNLNLKHHCLKTVDFKKNGGYTDTRVPLEIIKEKIIKNLPNNVQ